MTSDDMRVNGPLPAALPIPDRVSAFLGAVYGWMGIGLAVTATLLGPSRNRQRSSRSSRETALCSGVC